MQLSRKLQLQNLESPLLISAFLQSLETLDNGKPYKVAYEVDLSLTINCYRCDVSLNCESNIACTSDIQNVQTNIQQWNVLTVLKLWNEQLSGESSRSAIMLTTCCCTCDIHSLNCFLNYFQCSHHVRLLLCHVMTNHTSCMLLKELHERAQYKKDQCMPKISSNKLLLNFHRHFWT